MHLYDYLDSAVRSLREYVLLVTPEMESTLAVTLADEAVDRIEQANWLLKAATEAEDRARGAFARGGTFEVVDDELRFRIRLHTECFYLVADRAVEILENGWVLGIAGFKCVEIKMARNHLIVHPEKKGVSGVTTFSWGFFGDAGPVMKPIRMEAELDAYSDPGLFVNALALKDRVNEAVRTAMAQRT